MHAGRSSHLHRYQSSLVEYLASQASPKLYRNDRRRNTSLPAPSAMKSGGIHQIPSFRSIYTVRTNQNQLLCCLVSSIRLPRATTTPPNVLDSESKRSVLPDAQTRREGSYYGCFIGCWLSVAGTSFMSFAVLYFSEACYSSDNPSIFLNFCSFVYLEWIRRRMYQINTAAAHPTIKT